MKTPPARGARWAREDTLNCLLSGLTEPVRRPHRTGRQGPRKRSTEWESAVGRATARSGRRELAPLKNRDAKRRPAAYNAGSTANRGNTERGSSVIEIEPTTEELLATLRDAQRALEEIRLDGMGRVQAENRVHDARMAYRARMAELEAEELEPAEV